MAGEAEEDLNKLTVVQLRKKLRKRGLHVSGLKKDLIERLQAPAKPLEALTVAELKSRLQEHGLSTTGVKADLVQRLLTIQENTFTVAEVQDRLRRNGVPVTGLKTDLVRRLMTTERIHAERGPEVEVDSEAETVPGDPEADQSGKGDNVPSGSVGSAGGDPSGDSNAPRAGMESAGGDPSAGGNVPRGEAEGAGGEPTRAGMVEFGKHKGKLFEEVLNIDPTYCAWALATGELRPDTPIGAFAVFLGHRAPELRTLVGFGKYGGKTFQETLRADPDYCLWVLAAVEEPRVNPSLKVFAAWLREQVAELCTALEEQAAQALPEEPGMVNFGKHKGKMYEDVLLSDPDYCTWVLKAAEEPDASEQLLDFAEYLEEQTLVLGD